MRRLPRRKILALGLGAMLWALPAWAGSYLSRAAMLLEAAELEAKLLRARIFDKKLAETAHAIADARLRAAKSMEVPKEVARCHPHLLLCLEAYERACHHALMKEHDQFLVYLDRARRERSTFEALLKADGWTLPRLD